MALITAERFNNLKAAIKAECLRRSHTGSVAGYGGADYDYAAVPAAGVTIRKEHYSKNAVPMNAINSGTFPLPGDYEKIIAEGDLAQMESSVAAWATRGLATAEDNSASDCAASCTGLCHSCTGQCVSGCTGSCTGTCTGTCTGGCQGGCGGCGGCVGCGGCGGDCANCSYYWGG